MNKAKKAFTRVFAVLLVFVLLLVGLPVAASAAETNAVQCGASIPAYMFDNKALDALSYMGFNVKGLKDSGLLEKIYTQEIYPDNLQVKPYRTNVPYDNYYPYLTGKETVKKSGTATGKAPDITKFENNGLVCASFVAYYWLNYLPNIKGIDTGFVQSAITKYSGGGTAAVSNWRNALNGLVKEGKAQLVGTSKANTDFSKLVPGDIMTFSATGIPQAHVALYAGYYGGRQYIIHLGGSRGPEISSVEFLRAFGGNKASTPDGYYHIPLNEDILLRVGKQSANRELTDGNSCYDIKGAVYGVYTNASGTTPLKVNGKNVTITIDKVDSDGDYYGDYYPVPKGTYYCKEIKAPKGYLKDDKVYSMTATGNKSNGYPVYRSNPRVILEQPDNDPVVIVLQKRNASTGETGKKLAGAEYAVEYYSGFYTQEELENITPTRRWLIGTDENGGAWLDDDHLVKGIQQPEFYYATDTGQPALPLGTVKIYETKAPPGFLINDTPYVTQITGDGGQGTSQFNYPTFEEPEVSISTSATVNSVFESTTTTVTDTVYYTLEPNTDYTVTGWLVKKSSGAVVPLTGSDSTLSNNKVTKSFTTTADGKGSVQIKYNFNSKGYGGETVVAFAEVRNSDGTVVGEHKDIDSKDQSIQFKPPGIATSAISSNSNSRYIYPFDDVKITDTISFQNLISDTYTITPKAMLISKDGKSVEKEIPITIDSENVKALSGNGSVNVDFEISYEEFEKLVGNDESRLNELNGRTIVIYETLSGATGNTFKHEDMNDIAQSLTMITPTVATKATDSVTKQHQAYATDNLQIDDTVNLTGLIPNEAYSLIGQLVNKSTGKVLATSSEYITAGSDSQNVNMSFSLNASGYSGKDVVVYETLYYKGQIVAEHKNINDTAQTVTLLNPTISTRASGDTSISDDSEINDTVTITGLIPGKEYIIDGQLIDKETESAVELISAASGSDSAEIIDYMTTASLTFTATAETQTLDITYKFNSRPYAGKEIVVFETLKYNGIEIAKHNNLNDSAQTVKYDDMGDLCLRKYDTYTGNNLQRAVFNLYKIENNTEVLMDNCFTKNNIAGIGDYSYSSSGTVTDLEPYYYIPGQSIDEEYLGTMIVKGLPSGTYLIKEKKAPSGYRIDIADGVTFEVTPGETTELAVGNSPALVSLELIKTDDTDAAIRIAGVGFTLYSNEACTTKAKDFYGTEISEVITDSSGVVAFERIKYSLTSDTSYYLKETTTPNGYAPLDYIIRVSIDTEGNVSYYKLTEDGESQITDTVTRPSEGGDVTVTRIINKRLGSITVYKKSATDKTPLEGVVMNLSDSEGNTLHFSKDANGEYILDENGQTDIVTDKDGKAVMSGLLYGTYYVSEIKTLSNYYLLAENVEIQIDSESVSQEIFNTPKASLPTAGSFDKILWLLIGGAVAVCGLILLVNTIKKRKEESKMTKIKKYSKNFLTVFIVTLMLVSTLCVGAIGAVAANPYHIDETKTGSISFYKYEMNDISTATTPGDGTIKDLPAGATPLEGVEFTAYQISDLDGLYTYLGKKLPTPTEAENLIEAVPAAKTYTGITDENGYIKLSNLPLGIYYVKETFSPSQVSKKTASFVISVPTTSPDGTEWMYDLTVQPKNETKYADVTVLKTDNVSGAALGGFGFTLEEKIITKANPNGVWTAVATNGSTGTTGGTTPTGATWTTGANGKFTIDHLATKRAYRFKEVSATDKQYIVDSTVYYEFTVNADGTVTYDSSNFKNTEPAADNTLEITNETPEVHKSVSTDKTNWMQDVTQGINQTVYWKVSADIPKVVSKLSTYKITDTLSKGLTYSKLEVSADGKAVSTDDYTVTVSKEESGDTVITVDVVNKNALAGRKVCDIILVTTVNKNAVIGGDNPNEARLEYTNDVDTDSTYYKDTEEPEVHTGGYTWLKTNSDKQPLAGAEFKVYRSAEDAQNGTNPIKFVKTDGKYYISTAASASDTVVSDTDGYVTVLGLKYGTNGLTSENGSTKYYVAETKAPQGYNLLKAPFEITVTATSHNYAEGANVNVVNTIKTDLPHAGAQTVLYIFGIGAAVAAVGAFVFFRKKNKKCEEK